MMRTWIAAAGVLWATSASAEDVATAARAEAVLANSCVRCHGADAKKGGLDLSTRASTLEGGDSGPAVEPGKPEESLLVEKVEGGEMPPKTPLKPDEVEALRAWVASGAAYSHEPIAPRGPGPTGGRSGRSRASRRRRSTPKPRPRSARPSIPSSWRNSGRPA